MQTRPYLSVIIPAHNEERRLAECLDRWLGFLWEQNFTYEIIVVLNGCTDGTLKICERFSSEYAHVTWSDLFHRGKGFAVKKGMLKARGQHRYMADVDLSAPPAEVLRFIAKCREGFPVVIGSREVSPDLCQTTSVRRFIGRTFHAILHIAMPEIYVQDTQCGFKLFRWDAAEAIFRKTRINGMAFDVEMLYLASRMKCPVHELPIPWKHNPDSRVRLLRDGWQMFVDLLRIKSIHRRILAPRLPSPSPEEAPAD